MDQPNSLFDSKIRNLKRLKLAFFLFFAFCMLVISITLFALSLGKPFIGLDIVLAEQGWAVANTDANGIAFQAGINDGDRPVEVNNLPAQAFLETYEAPGIVLGRLVRQLTVEDEKGQLKSAVIPDGYVFGPPLITQLSMFFVCLIFWITGFYVFFKRPGNIAAKLFCICGLSFGLILCANSATDVSVPAAAFIQVIAAITCPWFLVHFFLVLPQERVWINKSSFIYLIYLPPLVTLILFPLIGWADGQALPDFRNIRFLEAGLALMAAVGVAIFNYVRAASATTRQQMKIILTGCLAALIPFLVTYLLPQLIWGQPIIPGGFAILFVVFIPIGVAYAVVTRKLLDIDIIIRRGVIYSLITIVMAIILSAAIFPIMAIQHQVGTPVQVLLALVLGGIATALFGPTKKGIEFLLDKFIYRDRYDYRQIIQSLSLSLSSLKDYSEVSRILVGTAVQSLNLAGGILFVKTSDGQFEVSTSQGNFTDSNKQLQMQALLSHRDPKNEFPYMASSTDPEVAFIIPLVMGNKEVGILLLAPKVTRQPFSSDDMFLIQGLASVSTVALHSAMLMHDVSLRDTFVSIASHELRTPLTVIIGFSELLQKHNFPENYRNKWLKNILDNGHRINQLVDDLLNTNRIQSGKSTIKLKQEKLTDILQDKLAAIPEKTDKHKFVVEIEPDLPDIFVDRDKFGQIINNLVNNAVKYSPKGGLITISAKKDPQLQRVIMSVADQGIGISSKDQNSLFKSFHRVHRPETAGIQGSGLGLYIVKEWIEAMGGQVWLESEMDKGSTFFVSVPIKESSISV